MPRTKVTGVLEVSPWNGPLDLVDGQQSRLVGDETVGVCLRREPNAAVVKRHVGSVRASRDQRTGQRRLAGLARTDDADDAGIGQRLLDRVAHVRRNRVGLRTV